MQNYEVKHTYNVYPRKFSRKDKCSLQITLLRIHKLCESIKIFYGYCALLIFCDICDRIQRILFFLPTSILIFILAFMKLDLFYNIAPNDVILFQCAIRCVFEFLSVLTHSECICTDALSV